MRLEVMFLGAFYFPWCLCVRHETRSN